MEVMWSNLALAPSKLAGKIIRADMEMLFQFGGLETAALLLWGESSLTAAGSGFFF